MNAAEKRKCARLDLLMRRGLNKLTGCNNELEVKRQYVNAQLDALRCLVRVERNQQIQELLLQHAAGVPHVASTVAEIKEDLDEESAPALWNSFGPHQCRDHCFVGAQESPRYRMYYGMLDVIETIAEELRFELQSGTLDYVLPGQGDL